MSIEFEYNLTGTGWAECRIQIGEAVARVTASYLGDALGDLASALAAALRGHPRPVASFWEEPGEYRCILEATRERGTVRVQVLEFPELWGDQPDERGKVLLDVECSLGALAEAVVCDLERLQRKHGVQGYRDMWVEHDFPTNRLHQIRELLRERGARSNTEMRQTGRGPVEPHR